MSPPRQGMGLLSLHAIGFDFETSEDTMSGRVQREEATMNRNIHDYYWATLGKVSCPETQLGPTGLMPEK